MNVSTFDRKRTKRRWFQFSLRAFVLTVLVGSSFVAYLSSIWLRADREQNVVEFLSRFDSQILYAYQFTNGAFDANGVAPGPQWMRRRLGEKFFSSVTLVQINGGGPMEGIECIQGLRKLESLTIYDCDELTNVDCLSNMPQLQYLDLGKCRRLANVDALKQAKKLQHVALNQCVALTNMDSLNDLPELVELELSRCEGLTSLEVLKRLRLRKLDLMMSALTDVEILQDQASLEELYLDGSESLTNVDGLKTLSRLRKLDLRGCNRLKEHQIDCLREQLPLANIVADY